MKKRLLSLALGCVAVSALGCNANYSQAAARDDAASHACKLAQKCGDIGSGKTYGTQDDCLTQQKNFWNDLWPKDRCENRIPPASLNTCTQSIDNIACSDWLQFAITIGDICSQARVCNAPDGGN